MGPDLETPPDGISFPSTSLASPAVTRGSVVHRVRRSARELRKPTWIAAYARGMAQARRRERRLRGGSGDIFSLADHPTLVRSLEAAIGELFPSAAGRFAEVVAGAWRPAPEPGDDTDWRSR